MSTTTPGFSSSPIPVLDSVPGIAYAIVRPDGIHAMDAAGFADIDRNIPTSTEMVSPWFSMTKLMTATVTLLTSGRGLLDLDEPIVRHVPAMGILRPAADAQHITARHLLSHSAGLANPLPIRWIHPADRLGPDPESFLLAQLEKHPKLRFAPGARCSYSNLGALILGAALTAVTSKAFVDLVRDEILDPLRMRTTGFTYVRGTERASAIGYHPRWNALRLLLPRWVIDRPTGRWVSLRPFLVDGAPYGGLVGSLEDAARFLQMHLRDGELEGAQVLTTEAARSMREIRVKGRRYDLGLGWFRPAKDRRADPPYVQHLGGGAGFFNVMRIYPTEGVGAVVMGNATKFDIEPVARLALA